MSEQGKPTLTRRSFLKTTGAVAGAAAVCGGMTSLAVADEETLASADEIQQFNGVCRSNCNFACRFTVNVKNDKVIKLDMATYDEDDYTGCCLKGLTFMERMYGPTRLKYPMKRVGERGSDEWEQISWDEAIDLVSEKMTECIEQYGPNSIIIEGGSGNFGGLGANIWTRFAWTFGLSTPPFCSDYAAGHGIQRVFGSGDWFYTNEPSNVLDSETIVVWGVNPVFTGPQVWRFTQRAKEGGANVIVIDPIKSMTAHKANDYIQVKPGTDAYLALAMCNYVIEQDWLDYDYLSNRSTAAFLVREDTKLHLRKSDFSPLPLDEEGMPTEPDEFYVFDNATQKIVLLDAAEEPALEGEFEYEGIKVRTAYTLLKEQLKQYTVSDASDVTGIPEDRIRELADEIAHSITCVNITYGTDHYVNGYLPGQAIATLLALTGNFEKPGTGFTGVWVRDVPSYNYLALYMVPDFIPANSTMPNGLMHEVAKTQQLAGQPYPFKMMISRTANGLSNLGGQNCQLDDLYPNLDFWVVVDMEYTDSVRYADLVLPCASWYEVEDIYNPYCLPYTILNEQAVTPLYESKSDLEIAGLIARNMGKTEAFPEDWGPDKYIELLLDEPSYQANGVTLENLRKNKYMRSTFSQGRSFVRGIDVPIPTESGRAQLYWENPKPRIDYGQDLSALIDDQRLPHYREPLEAGENNALREKYPLVFLQEHSRFRVHSQWFGVPTLRELDPEPFAKMNSIEAEARGLENGDLVEVYNDRGHAVCKCRIDESLAPGIVSIPKGWQRNQFVEGGFQEMTQPYLDPFSNNYGFYDALVEVRKA